MTANEYARLKIIGYRISDPELTTWNRLLDVYRRLRLRTQQQLSQQIDLMLTDEMICDEIRTDLKVSHRHALSRREVFNFIVKLHETNSWVFNWRLVLHIKPVAKMFANHIMIRVECGAITCDWFRYETMDHFDVIEDAHVKYGEDDSYMAKVWNEADEIEASDYTLTIIDNVEEWAQLCV